MDWIATPHIAADHRGPMDRPFTPFADLESIQPIMAMLSGPASRDPEGVVIEENGVALTFAALLAAVARLGDRILGAKRASGPVGILLPSNADYVVAVLATLAARRPSLLLDSNYPDERNAAVAAIAGADIILHPAASAPPSWPGIRAVQVEPAIGSHAEGRLIEGFGLGVDEPAFILPTSGSAGNPKLVAHSQRTILHWVRTVHDALHVDPTDRSLSLSSFCTLGGFVALMTFPLAGASQQILDIRTAGLAGLLDVLAHKPVTILRGTPSLLCGLGRLPGIGASLTGLRAVQLYGEPLMKADLDELRAVLPGACLVRTSYGSTEASGITWFAQAGEGYDSHRVATGTLMPDTQAAIVDEEGRSLPPGQAGELLIRSRHNAIGEWIDGRLVSGRLEADPDDPAARIFRSGDVARFHPDGVFVVLGRKDRMVKVNGQRIEPAEIETALRRNAMVTRAEVLAVDKAGAARLAAFVVAKPDAPAGLASTLKSELRETLPSFMVPSWLVIVPSIPLLPGGKVDAAALLRHIA